MFDRDAVTGRSEMSKDWTVKIRETHWEDVPASIHSERKRLNELLSKYCRGPYDDKEIVIVLGLWLEEKGGRPFKRSGVRLENPVKNIVGARIDVKMADWNTPLPAYRNFLWRNVEKGIWGCIETLKKKQMVMSVDVDRLRRDLALVESEFLGVNRESKPESRALRPNAPTEELTFVGASDDEMDRIVIQYRITGDRNGPDHDRRIAIENFLHECLTGAGLGNCDGGDIGSGTMNIFCFVSDSKKALKVITKALRDSGNLDDAVIGLRDRGEDKVVWPPDYAGEFSLV
jgi:hypothetical protein